mmetsp:Transcript_5506/g.17361  ORF Transcript_5506/g.17361 Transcript_5506/m.17361 type:complete len:217 (+) Transcript_5506:1788-2438(+)
MTGLHVVVFRVVVFVAFVFLRQELVRIFVGRLGAVPSVAPHGPQDAVSLAAGGSPLFARRPRRHVLLLLFVAVAPRRRGEGAVGGLDANFRRFFVERRDDRQRELQLGSRLRRQPPHPVPPHPPPSPRRPLLPRRQLHRHRSLPFHVRRRRRRRQLAEAFARRFFEVGRGFQGGGLREAADVAGASGRAVLELAHRARPVAVARRRRDERVVVRIV